jgi:hypothetical protein
MYLNSWNKLFSNVLITPIEMYFSALKIFNAAKLKRLIVKKNYHYVLKKYFETSF